ncbi:hypothetical protein U1Q18_009851 [Sarracenia purpurea var. burkii]
MPLLTRPLKGRGHIASQCPNKRVMVIRENGEFESEDEWGLPAQIFGKETIVLGANQRGTSQKLTSRPPLLLQDEDEANTLENECGTKDDSVSKLILVFQSVQR